MLGIPKHFLYFQTPSDLDHIQSICLRQNLLYCETGTSCIYCISWVR